VVTPIRRETHRSFFYFCIMEPDFEKIKKLASEYASTLGYFPGSCAAQNAAGYYCVVDGYIQGYLKAFEDTLSVLDDLFMLAIYGLLTDIFANE
jgi:hypothetical protein